MSPSPITPVGPFAGTAAAGAHAAFGVGTHLEGTVTALDRDGHPLVRTPQGVLTLPSNLPIKVGMRVMLELVQLGDGLGVKLLAATAPDLAQARAVPPPANPLAASNPQTATLPPKVEFAILASALAELERSAPDLSERAMQLLPGGTGAFLPALMNAANALRRGDLTALIGEAPLKAIDRARDRAGADRVQSELSTQPKLVSIDAGGAWQALFVPVLDGLQLRRIAFFARRPPEDGEDDERKPVRFLVEAEPSAIGPLQLDGFLSDRRLDLILRSEKALDAAWRDEIRSLYARTLGALDMAGELSFQVVGHFPLSGSEAIAAGVPPLRA